MGRRKTTGTFDDWFANYSQQNGIDVSGAQSSGTSYSNNYGTQTATKQKKKTATFNDWFTNYQQENNIDLTQQRQKTPTYAQPTYRKKNYLPTNQQAPSYTQNPLVQAAQNKINNQTKGYVTGSESGDKQYKNYLQQLSDQYKTKAYDTYQNDPRVIAGNKEIEKLQNQLINIGRTGSIADLSSIQDLGKQIGEKKKELSSYRTGLNNEYAFDPQQAYYDSMDDETLRDYYNNVIHAKRAQAQQNLINASTGTIDWMAREKYMQDIADLDKEGQTVSKILENRDWNNKYQKYMNLRNQEDFDGSYQSTYKGDVAVDKSNPLTVGLDRASRSPYGSMNGVGDYVQEEMSKYGDITYDYLNNDLGAKQVLQAMNPYGFRTTGGNAAVKPSERIENEIRELERQAEEANLREDYDTRDALVEQIRALEKEQYDYTNVGGLNAYYAWLTQDEKEVFNHLYKQSPKEAYDFIEFMSSELEKREREQNEAYMGALAEKDPVGMSMLSVSSALASPVAVASQFASLAKTGEFNANAWGNQASYIPKAIRNTVSQNIAEKSQVGSYLYNTAMSMADNVAQMLMTGGASQASVLFLMGTKVFADTVTEGVDQGKNTEDILLDSFVRSGVEVLTEKIGLDEVFDYIGGTRSITQLLRAAGAEGGEEGLADILNTMWDYAAQATTGKEAELTKKYNTYKLQGYSDKEAKSIVIQDFLYEMAQDMFGGALSGFAMAGGGAVANDSINGFQYNSIGRDIKQSSYPGSPFQNESNYKVGKRYAEMVSNNANAQQAENTVQKAAETLNERGYADLDAVQDILNDENAVKLLENESSIEQIKNAGDVQKALNEYAKNTEADTQQAKETLQNAVKSIDEEGNISDDTLNEVLENNTAAQMLVDSTSVKEVLDTNDVRKALTEYAKNTESVVDSENTKTSTSDEAGENAQPEFRNRNVIGPRRFLSTQQMTEESERNFIDHVAAERFGKAGYEVFRTAVQNKDAYSVDVRTETLRDFTKAFNAGMTAQVMPSNLALSEDIAKAAYESGRNAVLDEYRDENGKFKKGFTSYYGTEAGLVLTPETVISSKAISKRRLNMYANLGVALGTKLYPKKTMSQNGWYENAGIAFALDADNGVEHVLSHEYAHRLQEAAPEEYERLKNYIAELIGPEELEKALQNYYDLGKSQGVSLSQTAAMDEVVADWIAEHMLNGDLQWTGFVRRASQTSEGRGLLGRIRSGIKKLINKIRGINDPEIRQATERLKEAQRLLDEALNAAQLNVKNRVSDNNLANRSVSQAFIDSIDQTNHVIDDQNGNPIAEFNEDGSVAFSLRSYDTTGRQIYQKYLNKLVKSGELSQAEADDMRNGLETIYNICNEFAETGEYAPFTAWSNAEVIYDSKGKPVFSAVKKNSEYKMNIDFSTICKKRRTLDAVFREMINRGILEQLDLNKDESAAMVVNINDLIRKHNFEAACSLCFVEARRYRQQQTATTFRDMWNELVESMYSDKSKIAYFNFGQDSTVKDVSDGIHTMDNKALNLKHVKEVANARNEEGKLANTAEAKAARLLLKDPSQRKLMRIGDMMASTGFENMQIHNPELMKIYNSKKGTGGAKSSFGDVQYLNEIIRSQTFNRRAAYSVSGVRIQSFSDYVPRMVFDYVQVVGDLAAKKLPAHAYTKEVLFAKQFGLTGAKINL